MRKKNQIARPINQGNSEIIKNLKQHMNVLANEIGERSINYPVNLEKTADYIANFYRNIGEKTYQSNLYPLP